jgi:hypothetical protein
MYQRNVVWIVFILLLACAGSLHADLVGHWALDDGSGSTAADSSGNGFDGTIIGDLEWIPGVHGGALEFNDEAYVDCTSDAALDITGPFSATIWIRPGTEGNIETAPLAKADSAAGWSWQLRYGWGAGGRPTIMGWQFNTTGTRVWVWVQEELPVDEWCHIAAAHDGATVKCYLDGVETDSQPMTGFAGSGSSFLIGSDGWRSDWLGAIDDVRLYDHGLTVEELQDIIKGRGMGVAYNPMPEDESVDVSLDASLAWTPGEFANTHNLYLGANWDDVNDGAAETLVAEGWEANSYDPGRLVLGQTYYWRVDEVNAPPDNSVYTGEVWSFTVEPVSYAVPMEAVTVTASSATDAQPPDNTINESGLNANDEHSNLQQHMWLGLDTDINPSIQFAFSSLQKLDKVHVWNHNTQTESILGFGIKEALIETSADGETWSELGTVELPQASGLANYTGADVDLGGTMAQGVRITALSNYSILGLPQKGLSEVRFYAIPVQAREPEPADGSIPDGVDITLQWRAGREAVEHEVVFSTDEQAVIDGSAVVATVGESAHDLGTLELDTPYFWKINEMNDLGTPPVYEGTLWTFQTPDHLMIDDFERYTTREGLRIWEYWIDGFENQAENGAVVGNGDAAEKTVVYEGEQSMPIAYNNTLAPHSEVTRFFDTPVDLTKGQAEILKLQVIGDPNNGAAPMYVVLADTAGKELRIDHPDPAATALTDWDAWTIPLSELSPVNITKIDSITVGVGGAGVQGRIFVDAIRTVKADAKLE